MNDLKILDTNTYPLRGTTISQSLFEGDIRKSINLMHIIIYGTDYPKL